MDMSMGNPDQPTPRHIVDKLTEVAMRDHTHGYSASKGIKGSETQFVSGTTNTKWFWMRIRNQ